MSVVICIIDDTLHFGTTANNALHVLHCDEVELLPGTECGHCQEVMNLASAAAALSQDDMASGAMRAMSKMCCEHL